MTARGRHAARAWRPAGTGSGWWVWLAVWTVVGLAIRVATVAGRPHRVAGGDAFYYHTAANLLVAGKGFINPFLYAFSGGHHLVPTASFPPGFVFVLAAASAVGFKSFFAHRICCCLIGAAAVVVCGLTGREIAGRRVGLIAAFLVAVYPNIWMSDELALSEALSPLLAAVVLLAAYRFWRQPSWWRVTWLGAAIAVAALARDELALLAVLILAPLALSARGLRWPRRAALLGVGALAALVVVAPWVGYNLSRFQKPVFISSGLGVTLASANCDTVYAGPLEGYWSFGCALAVPIDRQADESVQGAEEQKHALHYVRSHSGRLPAVELARLGRAFGFFHPLEQVRLDSVIETRPYHWALGGLGMYYAMLCLSLGGLIVLRRRRVPVLPLLAVGLDVALSTAITFGTTRYRSTFEVSLVLLSAVQLDWLWGFFRHRGRPEEGEARSGGAEGAAATGPAGVAGVAGGAGVAGWRAWRAC